MADKKQKWQEIANRGLQDNFDPETRVKFDEAVKRGLITMPQANLEPSPTQQQPVIDNTQSDNQVIEQESPQQAPTAESLAPQQLHNRVIGGLEGALQVGSGIAGEIVGGVTATVDLLNPFTSNDPVQVLNNVKDILQYEPRGVNEDAAIQQLATTLEPIKPIIESIDEFVTKGADYGADVTGSPAFGAFMKTIPAMAGEMSGLSALGKVNRIGDVPQPKSAFKNPEDARKAIYENILSDEPNIDSVTKIINDSGDIITNKAVKRALTTIGKDLGEEAGVALVSVMEKVSPATKKRINKMLDGINNTKTNPLNESRPSDVVGDAVVDRAKAINRVNKRAGKRIGNVAEKLKDTKVDLSQPVDQFFDKLSGMGVTFTRGDDGWVTPNFKRSDFSGGSQQDMEVLINKLVNKKQGFKDAHELKKFIRKNINFDTIGSGKLDTDAEKILSDLSSDIDGVLDTTSDVYRKANEDFAKTIDLKSAFNKLAGKDLAGNQIDIFDSATDAMFGDKARRITSNAPSRTPINSLIKDADKILGEFNINFKDDIRALTFVSDSLTDAFKLAPANSLKGNLTDAAAGAAAGVPLEAQAGNAIARRIKNLSAPDFNKKMKAYRSLANQKQ